MNKVIFENNRTVQISSAALTERGRKRILNEDRVFHRTGQTVTGSSIGLYIVCDGLGGHQAGEVASNLATTIVTNELEHLFMCQDESFDSQTICQMIRTAIDKANEKIREYAAVHPQEASNLGSTITLALVYEGMGYIANVGDSRAYLWREGQLEQITRDHSLVAELVKLGIIEQSEIFTHPQRNMLLQALGSEFRISADLFTWHLEPGDKLLLCSDGLWQAFPETSELAGWLASDMLPAKLCQKIVAQANLRDGSDNISAVIIDVDEIPGWHSRIFDSLSTKIREAVLIK